MCYDVPQSCALHCALYGGKAEVHQQRVNTVNWALPMSARKDLSHTVNEMVFLTGLFCTSKDLRAIGEIFTRLE